VSGCLSVTVALKIGRCLLASGYFRQSCGRKTAFVHFAEGSKQLIDELVQVIHQRSLSITHPLVFVLDPASPTYRNVDATELLRPAFLQMVQTLYKFHFWVTNRTFNSCL
jgi:hypothetical protein